ncbi:hypothetical protein [Corynebacterium stationis]|uniref:hypothetical protein n=1 Tax=Corynebacterium stationis TaxID=1705 RepID=UPI0026F0177A|nr:hypothetical protein [Corynebacterium stationis]
MFRTAADDGEDRLLRPLPDVVDSTAELLVVSLQGSQITAVMDPEGFSTERILNHLEAYLTLLRR